MSEGFTSRHGKYTAVVAEEIAKDTTTPKQPRRPRRKRLLPIKLKLSKRAWLIIAGIFVVLALVALLSADSVKRDYDRQAAAMNRTILDAGKRTPSDSASGSSVADTLLEALNALSTCRVAGIDVISWYGPAKDARDNCQQTAERYLRLRTALMAIRDTDTYMRQVNETLVEALAEPSDGNYAVIGEYADRWTSAQQKIAGLQHPTTLNSIHDTLVARVSAVQSAWSTLSQASQARDVAKFKSTESELGKSYENLRTTSDQLRTWIQQQQTIVTQSVTIPL